MNGDWNFGFENGIDTTDYVSGITKISETAAKQYKLQTISLTVDLDIEEGREVGNSSSKFAASMRSRRVLLVFVSTILKLLFHRHFPATAERSGPTGPLTLKVVFFSFS